MKVMSVSETTREVMRVETTSVPDEVLLTIPVDEFIALVSLWATSFGGHDGDGGLRDRLDDGMRDAWKQVFPSTPRPYFDNLGNGDATSRALAAIKLVLGS